MPGQNKHARRNVLPWLVVILASGACDAGTASNKTPAAQESPQESSAMEPSPTPGITAIECGQPFQAPTEGVLALAGQFPADVSAGQETLSGSVEVTSQQELQGLTPPGADAFLVSDGRVVTIPLPQDAVGMLFSVAPGETISAPAEAVLVSCDSGDPLAPGTYELYARLVVIPDGGGSVESFGGPWPLQVQ
jgi:hypothetical protein